MSYITIENPIAESLTLQFKGEMYSIDGKSKREFPADVAGQWMFIYAFLKEAKPEPKVEKEVTKEKVAKK